MRGCVKQGLKERFELIGAALFILFGLGLAGSPVQANRGIPIDNFTSETWSDADNAEVVPLPFAVDYGAGPQSSVTVQLPSSFASQPSGPAFAAVGLTFTNSPSDVLFAKVLGSPDIQQQLPAVRLSDGSESSTPLHPVSEANTFDFGVAFNLNGPSTANCEMSGISTYCYGSMTDSAIFQFLDESGSGNPGDFEVVLQCINDCTNIGFNLAGLNFSADDFDPNAQQAPQFLSYVPPATTNPFIHRGTWSFLFRNPAAVPEPSTWASMLLGFLVLGGAARRRRLKIQSS